MRMFAYAVAVLAAAGIVVLISNPDSQPKDTGQAAATVTPATDDPTPVTGEQLVIHVPKMHCPHGCYPAVKEALTTQPGVKKVELVKQADENAIDNPRVQVIHDPSFNADAAVAALTDAGFGGSTVERTN